MRKVHVIEASVTSGADVLFPGGSRVMTFDDIKSRYVLSQVNGLEAPEFAYLPVDAWGEPCEIGTLAVIDDLEQKPLQPTVKLIFSGLCRFKVIELSQDRTSATIVMFHDKPPAECDRKTVEDMEAVLVEQLKDILRLSIKVAGADQEPERKEALAETLKRMNFLRTFFTEISKESPRDATSFAEVEQSLLKHWILALNPDRRREILSFLVLDLLSMSFMDRREILMSTDTMERLRTSQEVLEPLHKELAAKGAIISALGNDPLEFGSDCRDSDPST